MDTFIVPPHVTAHRRLHEIIGENWLKQQVESVRVSTHKKDILHPARMSPAFGYFKHPLVLEGKKDTSDMNTPLMDSLETDLTAMEGIRLPSDLGERLRSEHDCNKVAYELRIAAGFSRLGYPVTWSAPSKTPSPEFTVSLPNSNLLSVECKKRDQSDGYEQDGARFWEHLQYGLRIKMEAASLNYWVAVTGRDFNLKDVDSLVSEIIYELLSKEYGQFESKAGPYHVQYTKLAEPGKEISMNVVNMFPRGIFGMNMGKQDRNQIMKGPLKDPKLLRLEITDDLEHRMKGILRNLKTAAHQVIRDIPNLVYIDVNLPEYTKEQEEFGSIAEAINSELANRHRQISAVIVTNIYPSFTQDGYLGWRIRMKLIEHPDPLVRLPQGLQFPGDNLETHWISGRLSVKVLTQKAKSGIFVP